MKIKLTLFLFVVFSFSYAQMSIKKLDGSVINNNDVIVFNEANETDSYLGLKVFNTSSNPIRVKLKVVSMLNSDGNNLQLCFAELCYGSIVAGESYPSSGTLIPANGSNGNFDHFLNTNTGINVGQNVDYVLKFIQIDNNNVELPNSVTFTYRYASNLSTNQNDTSQNSIFKLNSNIVDANLEFEVLKPIDISIYDLSGKKYLNANLAVGNQSFDVSNLSTGLYLINYISDDEYSTITKFIKR